MLVSPSTVGNSPILLAYVVVIFKCGALSAAPLPLDHLQQADPTFPAIAMPKFPVRYAAPLGATLHGAHCDPGELLAGDCRAIPHHVRLGQCGGLAVVDGNRTTSGTSQKVVLGRVLHKFTSAFLQCELAKEQNVIVVVVVVLLASRCEHSQGLMAAGAQMSGVREHMGNLPRSRGNCMRSSLLLVWCPGHLLWVIRPR